MNLYDQLLSLQVIENAFTKWRTYRSALTHYIISRTSPNEDIAIFGAGRCNDIDLNLLTRHAHSITLLDQDKVGMEEALKKYNLEDHPGIHIQQTNFTGISSDMYRHYADSLISEVRRYGHSTDCRALAKTALLCLDTLASTCPKPYLGERLYDTVIAIGVHSQLLSMLDWIWQVILETLGQEEDSVRQKIAFMNNAYTNWFNTLLIDTTKHRLIIGCEEERLSRPGSIQGALQGMKDIELRIREGELILLDKDFLLWPFDESRQIIYKVQLQHLQK